MSHFDINNGLGISRIAIHEAGHVAVALYLECFISDVTIISDDKSDGCTNAPDINSWSLEKAALFKIAGIVAEKILLGDNEDYHHYLSDGSDIEKKYKLKLRKGHIMPRGYPQYVAKLEAKCCKILNDSFGFCLLQKITISLDKRKSLNSEDLQAIFESCKVYGSARIRIE